MGRKSPTFPSTLFVNLEEDSDGSSYPVANEDIDSIEDDELVGVYTLTSVGKKVTSHQLANVEEV